MGLPYVLSSDLVSAYPAKSLEIAQYVDGLIPLLAMTQNAQTGVTYSFVLTDFTKLVTLSNASAVAVTLPLEATVAWPTGTQLRLLNVGAGTVTVAGAVGVTINGAPLTLAQYKGANLIKTGTNTWVFIPFASGVGAAVYSDANTGTYTGFAYKTFTASGTLTVTTAGFADIVAVAGGAGGGGTSANQGGGGGAGGVLQVTNAYLPVGTLTITIGAGGVPSAANGQQMSYNGNATRISDYYAIGGGCADSNTTASTSYQGNTGGSGGGGTGGGAGGTGMTGQGNTGGASVGVNNGGGGGGGGGVGGDGAGTTGGAGGTGVNITIAGTTPTGAYVAGNYTVGGGGGGAGAATGGTATFGGGGGGAAGGAGTTGTANKGGGGGGGGAANGGTGGSGIVIVRVAV